MVVALRQPIVLHGIQRVGWWRVDPASGATIGVMDTGFHGDSGEYGTLVNNRTAEHASRFAPSAGAGASPGLSLAESAGFYGTMALATAFMVCMIYDSIMVDPPDRHCAW